MKKNLLFSFKFLIIGYLLLLLLSHLIDYGVKHSYSDQIGKINLIEQKLLDPDIMVFGSSVGEVGLNSNLVSEKTGLSVFNCSVDGTSYIGYKGIIDEFNEYSKNNKYVIFMESYFSFQMPVGISSPERYMAHIYKENIYESLRYIQPDISWKSRYIPFYKYTVVTDVYYKNCIKGWINFIKHKSFKDSLNGYTPVLREWEMDQDEILKDIKPFKIELNTDVIYKYKGSIKAFNNNHKKVIIVLPPIYSEISNKLTDFNPLRKTLETISKGMNVLYFDFTTSDICNHKEYFYNSNHLNDKGSKIFSEQLADSINKYFSINYNK